VVNAYGPTVAAVGCCVHAFPAAAAAAGEVPIGAPIANVRLYVADRRLQPCPTWVAGELLIGGAGLARGYLGAPALTAERFIPDPFSGEPGARIYRSGDRVRRDDRGRLRFGGRLDDQVKLRGHRIEPAEIEAALLRDPRVAEAAVALRGAGDDRRLAAYVVLRAGADAAGLRDGLAAWLPAAMVPATVTVLDRLPLTRHGKVDRAALPEPAAADAGRAEWEAPRTDAERLLAAIWSDLLKTPAIGRGDDFFALGGHSLLATELAYHVLQTFGAELDLPAFFAGPTLAELARRLTAPGATGARGGIPRADRAVPLPLSFQQQRLWFLDRLQPGSAAYHVPAAVLLRGRLEAGALAAALGDLAARHETLRTRLAAVDGEPVQRIAPPAPMPLPRVDLAALGTERRRARLALLARAHARAPFDLERGPLARAALVRLGADEHALLVTLHHVISDGASVAVLIDELAALYRARRERRPHGLPELPVQYADYAAWQRRRLDDQALAEGIEWWRRRLRGAPPGLDLPTDRPRPRMQGDRGGVRSRRLPDELVREVRRLCRRRRTTPFVALLAAFFALMQRWTGGDDLVVGTDVANRSRPETRGLIGFFINQLALRADLAGAPTFAELLERTRRVVQEALVRQDLPFDRVVEAVAPERDLARPPLFQVAFTHETVPALPASVDGLELEPLALFGAAAKLDLEVNVQEVDGGWTVHAVYDAGLFDAVTLERTLERYERLLAALAADPGRRPCRVALVGDAERRRLAELGAGPAADLGTAPAHRRILGRAAATPDAVAAVCGDRHLTYGLLARRVEGMAAALAARGVGRGDIVALVAERGLDLLLAQLAALEAGAAWLPLDPRGPAARHRQLLARARPAVVVTGEGGGSEIAAALAGLEGAPPAVSCAALATPPARGGRGRARAEAAGLDDLAYVLFTSGSTGVPKGAAVHHRGMLNHLLAKVAELGLGAADVVAQTAPQSFDISIWQTLAPLLAGGRLEIFGDPMAADPARLAAALSARRVTVLQSVPSLLRVAFDEGGGLVASGRGRSPLRWLSATGEALPPELARRWLAARPEVPLLNAYGPTECADDVTHHVLRRAADLGPGAVPIGRPLPNLRLVLLDRWGGPAPLGVPGELCVGGLAVGRGYLGDPRRTAQAFRPDPLAGAPGAVLYHTGDLCRHRAGGELEFLGRIDHQVKVRGFRVEPGEVEAVLGGHPAVRAAVAGVHRDEAGDDRLAAWVVVDPAAAPAAEELARFVAARLPGHMVPVAFCFLGALPLTPSGKVDRRALPAPSVETAGRRPEYEPPAAGTEAVLAGLWRDLLGVERVGRRDDLFDLGGHSLTATRLVARIRSALAVELPLREVFLHSTLAALARRVDDLILAAAGDAELAALLDLVEGEPAAEERADA
jgi:amino acid adenylation domain-containing protein